ncbi:family 78 glycoside hydrolase catalytic domain [Salinisphaera sp. SPP-AMP-43]|uniref:family 78 glycoside hydrolase catalytic domain n=1 Tax=Salinisphaera sp. SPP-AMP-43 TaxID=3121288 RepID=UPI003C6DD908
MTKVNQTRRRILKLAGGGVAGIAAARLTGPIEWMEAAEAAQSDRLGIDPRAPSGLLMDLLPEPLGIRVTDHRPRLSWIVPALGPVPQQAAYRVQIGRSRDSLASGTDLVWDSGRVESDRSTGIAYGGPALAPNSVYYWRVRTWQQRGHASMWSEPQRLVTEMGEEWTGSPIWAPRVEADPDQGVSPNDWLLARTEFQVDGDIEAAWIQASGRSPEGARQYVFRLAVNDRFAGVGPVRAFDPDTETRYHTYDITNQLKAGANVVSAFCYTADEHAFLADIVIVYRNGRRQVIGTGRDWRVRLAGGWRPPAGFTGGGFYQAPQEYIDARAEPLGWRSPGYDDSAWAEPVEAGPLPGLAPSWDQNIACIPVKPESSTQLDSGHWLIDMGREVVGGLRLNVTARAGQQVEVRLGEERADDGGARYELRVGQTYREVWMLRDGAQSLQHWGYRAFRWVELIAAPDIDVISGLQALVLRQPWTDNEAEFASSNSALDRVWELCRYSIKALRVNVYEDTPTRERGPYEGDAIINQLSEYNVQRSYALARYSTSYLARRPTWPTEYHVMTAILAWRDYLATGDDSNLADDYDLLVERQLTEYLNAEGLVDKSPGEYYRFPRDLVDWPRGYRDDYVFTNVNTVINAWQYAAYEALSRIAGVLGRGQDQRRFASLADRLQQGLNSQLIAGNGAYYDGIGTQHQAQHATAFPLALGVTEDAAKNAAGQWLAGQGMRGSVYGAQQLLDALYNANEAEAALALLTSRAQFSWLHVMDDLGATITPEAWDPSVSSNMSLSHAWGTAPANTVMRYIAGVTPVAPGAARLRIAPQPAGLDWFKARVPTIRGPVSVVFQRGQRQLLEISLPPNTESEIELDLSQMGALDPNRVTVQGRGYKPQSKVQDQRLTVTQALPGTLVVLAG